MSTTLPVLHAHAARPPRIARMALALLVATAGITALPHTAAGQRLPGQEPKLQFLVSSGAVVPTGAHRDAIKRGNYTTAQLFYAFNPALAVNATLGWARPRAVSPTGSPKVDVFTYDLGAELRAPRWHTGRLFSFRPFAGIGAGARSYDYRSRSSDATHNIAAYGSVGGEVGIWRVRVRLEARDYVTGFKPLDGPGSAVTRNDVALLVGLSFVKP